METQLGLGLIGIGKPWGYRPSAVPGEREALAFLESAWRLGIRYFDTAASYGGSEERLGRFLKILDPPARAALTVATKFGEHWDAAAGQPYVDHSYTALKASLDRSVERLGAIDVLQLHKTTPEVLCSDDLARAWEYAASLGITATGPSVSDVESARMAVSGGYRMLQAPFNTGNTQFGPVLEAAHDRHMLIVLNRPFAMGKIVYAGDPEGAFRRMVEAFRFIRARRFPAVVLTGTRSAAHLQENWRAFQEATGVDATPGAPSA